MSAVGGAERMTVTFARQLDMTKYDVKFCILEISQIRGIEDFIPKDYPVLHVPFSSFGLNLKLLSSFRSVLNEEKPDIVFSSLISINFRLLLLAPFYKKTTFIVRNNIYLATSSKYQKTMIKLTYKNAAKIIAQTIEMKAELDELLKQKKSTVEVVQNPVDVNTIHDKLLDYEPFMNPEKVNYVAVGRFAPSKGFDVLVRAFSNVLKKQPHSELYIVGRYNEQDDYFKSVWQWVKSNEIEKQVHLVGHSDNPYKYMKNADCFVLSSRNEGLPNVLIEALYIGTPSAACTCIPVIERIVENGKTGYLANSEDFDGLAEAMLNAACLGQIKSTYQSSSIEQVLKYFD